MQMLLKIIQITTTITTTRLKLQRLQQLRQLHHQFHILVTYTLQDKCTWYVYDKVGGEIGSTLGNANNWAAAAEGAGFTVNHTPSKKALSHNLLKDHLVTLHM